MAHRHTTEFKQEAARIALTSGLNQPTLISHLDTLITAKCLAGIAGNA